MPTGLNATPASGVRVISERNLDFKTIVISDDSEHIKVQVSAEPNNLLEVKDDGLFVASAEAETTELVSLGGVKLGKVLNV